MNKFRLTLMFIAISFMISCSFVRPFFIKNTKKEERKEKRVDKKIDRKETKNAKKSDQKEIVKIVETKETIKDSIIHYRTKIDTIYSGTIIKHRVPKSSTATNKDTLVILPLNKTFALSVLTAKRIEYTTYQCKAKMHIDSDKDKQNFNINFRLKKDSVIWASINAPIVGEVARAIITKDSVIAMDRFNKKMYLYSYQDLQKLINLEVDFNTLQEIIIGNAIATNGDVTDIKELGALLNIFVKGADFTNHLTYSKNDTTLKQLQIQTSRPASSSSLLIALSEYEQVDNRWFPMQRQFNILDVRGAMQVDMDINKAEFDLPFEFPFSIPKNYKLQK